MNNIKPIHILFIAVALVLLIANAYIYIFDDKDSGLSVKQDQSYVKYDMNKLPSWLQSERKSGMNNIDLFHATKKDLLKPSEAATFQKNQLPVEKLLPKIQPMQTDKLNVLAINYDEQASSAMVKYQGEILIVFEGDEVGERYIVKRIDQNDVFFYKK